MFSIIPNESAMKKVPHFSHIYCAYVRVFTREDEKRRQFDIPETSYTKVQSGWQMADMNSGDGSHCNHLQMLEQKQDLLNYSV